MNLQEAIGQRIAEIVREARKTAPEGYTIYQDGCYWDWQAGYWIVVLRMENLYDNEAASVYRKVKL